MAINKINLLTRLHKDLLCSISQCGLILYILMVITSDNYGKGRINLFTIKRVFGKNYFKKYLKEGLAEIKRFNLVKFRINKKEIRFKLGN